MATASSVPTEKASATEARYNKLKEKHSELINTHAELLRKVGPYSEGREGSPSMAEPEPNPSGLSVQNADTAKQLTVTQQSQEEVARVKEQLAFQVEQVKRESEMKVRFGAPTPTPTMPRAPPTMPRARPSPLPPVTSCPTASSWKSRVTSWRSSRGSWRPRQENWCMCRRR